MAPFNLIFSGTMQNFTWRNWHMLVQRNLCLRYLASSLTGTEMITYLSLQDSLHLLYDILLVHRLVLKWSPTSLCKTASTSCMSHILSPFRSAKHNSHGQKGSCALSLYIYMLQFVYVTNEMMHAHVHACMCTCACVCACAYTCVCICIQTCVCVCVCVCVHGHARI